MTRKRTVGLHVDLCRMRANRALARLVHAPVTAAGWQALSEELQKAAGHAAEVARELTGGQEAA